MIGFELLRPWLAWSLALAPLALALGWLARQRTRAELALWVAARRQRYFLPGRSAWRAWLRLGSGTVALFFLALAALGPVRGYTYRAVTRRGLDLVVCLDTSRSMLAQDLRPSRLERARREIVGLLDLMRGDRVALVSFAGDARDVAPLTRDRGTLEGLLGFVSPEDNREGGTDLAAAIEHALALFDGRTGAHEAIVLLTDGEDLAGEAASQAEEARKRGIRIFVVGVGTEAGGKIPVVEDGRPAFLRDPEGNEVVTRLEGASLAALARSTGGEYLSAEQSPTPLEDLYRARVTRLEGRESEGDERRVPYDRFQWPLALALFFLVLESAVPLRASQRSSRASGARKPAGAALACLMLAGGDGLNDGLDPGAELAEVVRHHRAGRSPEAETAARNALAKADELGLGEPLRARAQHALGVVLATRAARDEAEETAAAARDEAREAFSAARALAGPGELRLFATYDLGAVELEHAERVRARIPEIAGVAAPPTLAPPGIPPVAPEADPLPEARSLYLAARSWLVERLRLDWRDEDTRANLELVQRRLRELDDIEKRREEQEQQQQQQDPSDSEGEESKDPADPDQEKEKNEDPKGDPKDPQEGDEPKEGEEPPEDEPKPGEEQPPEGKPEPPQGEAPPEGEPSAPETQPAQPSERVLTREEVMQLLDKLAELEKRQRALEAASRAKSRARTARDW